MVVDLFPHIRRKDGVWGFFRQGRRCPHRGAFCDPTRPLPSLGKSKGKVHYPLGGEWVGVLLIFGPTHSEKFFLIFSLLCVGFFGFLCGLGIEEEITFWCRPI